MTGLACVLWWVVLGALLGLVGSWLIGRMLRRPMSAPAERVVEKIVEKPVDRIVEKVVERPVDRIVEKVVEVERIVPDTAALEALRARIAELEAGIARPAIDLAAARAAGLAVKGEDDLEIVEGIGPKIAQLLHAKGIVTFAQLADAPVARIREILDEAGPNYRIADPGTWPEQAALAARNRWAELKALQDRLTAGRR